MGGPCLWEWRQEDGAGRPVEVGNGNEKVQRPCQQDQEEGSETLRLVWVMVSKVRVWWRDGWSHELTHMLAGLLSASLQ